MIAASGSQESIEVSADTPDVTTVAATTTATKATTESRNTVAVTSAAPETGADDVTWVDYMSYVDFLGNVGKYHGDVKNGFPHGVGQFKYNSEDSVVEYNGNWENGFRCGQGKETISYRNGNSFIGEGTFSNDQLNGEAVWTQNYTDQPGIESQTWKGTCINDIFNGAGTITTVYSSGDIKVDEGEFTDDILNGKGTTTYHYADGTGEILSGEFKNGELVNYTTTPIENTAVESTDAKDTVLNIYAWNEEFKGFFEKYMPGYDNSAGTLDGVKVNWTIVPSYDLAYQNSLDRALMNNASASKENKVDLFLAEADYILKYTDSDYTLDISTIGLKQVDTEYQYTVDAATDSNGRIKGVSFQCCPSALIYRRSIAKAVLGTDDPDQVQAKLDSWDKFDAVAAQADKLGYYMTPSFAETYRVFSNNTNSPWVTNGELAIPNSIKKWINQAATYVKNYYTLPVGIWDSEKTDQMFKNGKTMCFFGPAWYFNFCMGNAYDPEYGSIGDWAICKGPQAHFWGGTWLLAASGTDNPALVAKVMRAFTENEEVCEKLIRNEAQFTNNSKVNERFASDPNYGNAFLGGQNDVAVFAALSDDIVWKNATVYDQACNERLQEAMRYCFDGYYGTDGILPKFYELIKSDYPSLKTP